MNTEFALSLVSLGGRRWQKSSLDRVYIPVSLACEVIGLRVQRYGSGNVSSATLAGEKISNTSGRDMLSALDGIYYDVVTGKFVGSHYGVASALRERIGATVSA